jgi:hypothetical protein
LKALIRELDDISILTRDMAVVQHKSGECGGPSLRLLVYGKTDKAMKAITRNIDRRIWRDLMNKSGMLSLMDAEARDEWQSLEDDIPRSLKTIS